MKRRIPGKISQMAISQLFQKPATIAYPKGEMDIVKNYRGMLVYDPKDCINCRMCERDCPTGAIKITNEGTKEERKMSAVLDISHCVFCCQCVDICPKKSLSFSQNIDLSNLSSKDFKVKL
ncbi:MAG TPA: 4Fe-4S dicluster domain-containing protein [Oscillospiraceae bacterium]|nr:4Fe-4S dicluster domain-containing protein [Oscillospiraceae bacterium]HPS35014.1 4Fe-4S dicluster domain-containing protein [Oscillospiraceae bacterium]